MQKTINYTKYVFWLLALLPIFLMRDFAKGNELTYLSIADQALQNGNLFAFYNHGAIYADKPPLYIWLIMLGEKFWNSHCMLWMGIFSIVPAFVILYIMDKWCTPIIDKKYRTAGQWLLLTTGLFIGSTVIVRMDMLMSMFIVLALYTFYKMYTEGITVKRQFLLPFYIFLAVFTKGPLGLLIPVLSIFVFLIAEKKTKQLKYYLGWKTWAILVTFCFLWFMMVFIEGGKTYLYNLLFHQTFGRAYKAFAHRTGFFYYFYAVIYSMAPWIILYICVIYEGIKKKLIVHPIQRFFLTVFVVTFVLLSCISSKIEIYLLPAYPFIVFLVASLMKQTENETGPIVGLFLPALCFTLSLPAMLIMRNLRLLPTWQNPFIYAATAILSFGGVVMLVQLIKTINSIKHDVDVYGQPHESVFMVKNIRMICLATMFALFVASGSLPNLNDDIGYSQLAKNVTSLAKENNIYCYYSYHIKNANAMDYYLDMPVTEIPKPNPELLSLVSKPYLFFVPTKYWLTNKELQKITSGKKHYQKGKYSFFVCY